MLRSLNQPLWVYPGQEQLFRLLVLLKNFVAAIPAEFTQVQLSFLAQVAVFQFDAQGSGRVHQCQQPATDVMLGGPVLWPFVHQVIQAVFIQDGRFGSPPSTSCGGVSKVMVWHFHPPTLVTVDFTEKVACMRVLARVPVCSSSVVSLPLSVRLPGFP